MPARRAQRARRVLVDVSGSTCPTKGSEAILDAFREAVTRHGLQAQVQVTGRGCFGLCRMAPNLYVEPDGVWYSRLTVDDVETIVTEHLLHGRVVDRLVHYTTPNYPAPHVDR